jgi:hypothetical protein
MPFPLVVEEIATIVLDLGGRELFLKIEFSIATHEVFTDHRIESIGEDMLENLNKCISIGFIALGNVDASIRNVLAAHKSLFPTSQIHVQGGNGNGNFTQTCICIARDSLLIKKNSIRDKANIFLDILPSQLDVFREILENCRFSSHDSRSLHLSTATTECVSHEIHIQNETRILIRLIAEVAIRLHVAIKIGDDTVTEILILDCHDYLPPSTSSPVSVE